MRLALPLLAMLASVTPPVSLGPDGGGELLVASAVSLRAAVTELARRFEEANPGARVRTSFGASSALAAQVRLGAPVDVFVSADVHLVDELEARGLLAAGERFPVARNRLVAVARADLGATLARAEDLAGPSVRRLAIPHEAVPVGRYAREWLARRGLLAALEPRTIPTEHARATLAAVDAGHADAALVYATDARLARSARIAFEVPADEQPHIVYTAALVRATPRRELARAFLAMLRGDPGRHALREAGFTVDAYGPAP